MSKALRILGKLKDQVFMTEKGLVSFEPVICEAIAELGAMQARIKELENEVSIWKDDADKERLGVIIDCLTLDCNKKDKEIKKLSLKCSEIAYDFENAVNEIDLLKQCVDEAIKRPMGVEPSIYSDYKRKREML